VRGHGRDPAEFHFRPALRGETRLDDIVRLAELGAKSVHVRLWPSAETDVQVKRDALRRFADDVITPYRELAGTP
jgi:hypothetical protein